MSFIVVAVQLIIGLGLLNVWLLRTGKATEWRGGEAQNMREEFATYGLPYWFMLIIGCLKVTLAILLIVGIWVDSVARPAAVGIAILMLGAVIMHVRVGDPLRKSAPAFSLLVLSLVIVLL